MRGRVMCEIDNIHNNSCDYIWKNKSVTDTVWYGKSAKFVQELIRAGCMSKSIYVDQIEACSLVKVIELY